MKIEGFHDLGREIDELANQFEELGDKHGRGNVRSAITRGVTSAFADISSEARRRAKQYVPAEEATTITHQSRGFMGDEYRHDMISSSVIVASHEFGSGLYSMNGRGTIDVPGEGYFIPKPPDSDTTLKLTDHSHGGYPIFADYVIHPGVKPKRFMYKSVVENEDTIVDRVEEQLQQVLEERGLA